MLKKEKESKSFMNPWYDLIYSRLLEFPFEMF